MSTQYYDDLWQDAMGELGEQLHIEGADEEDEDPTAPKSVSIKLSFPLSPLTHSLTHSLLLIESTRS